MDERYDPAVIEPLWQERWADARAFRVDEAAGDKFYLLEMFAYPSGRIHMGHVRNYSIGDVVARHLRMRGKNVLHPMGWDAFGMPAENAAMERGRHPHEWTLDNIAQMKKQLARLGLSYDWDREITTCEPSYYRHEQAMFVRMLERGLAYRKHALANWCEQCATVLANEQVEDGQCWRCGSAVAQKAMAQWFLRVTDYAEELLSALDTLEGKWPADVLQMQRNWIGKSHGAEIEFALEVPVAGERDIRVFTTRPDTLYGVTFMSIAAEHPLALELARGTEHEGNVARFVERVRNEHKQSRGADAGEKEGVFTGRHCLHPLTGERVPVYIANFVLMDYGTGAVMAVPAHDQRDFEFARRYGLSVQVVIQPEGGGLDGASLSEAYTEAGVMVNSGPFDGRPSEVGKAEIVARLQSEAKGRATVSYRLRDWLISRQRYWGAPIPVVHCEYDGIVPVPLEQLPVKLPTDVEISGTGGSPLARHAGFAEASCPRCGRAARRETDTFDTFVESSWYYARFTTPDCESAPVDQARGRPWLPVDFYIGGKEHAVMHLLYARFWHRVMIDLDFLPRDTPREPFSALLCQGMVCKEFYYRLDPHNPAHKLYYYPEETDLRDGVRVLKADGLPVEVGNVSKMSKTKRNIVDPDDIIARYGADTARLFMLFAAPPEGQVDWTIAGVEGAYRFLQRVWRLVRERLPMLDGVAAYSGAGELSPAAVELRRAIHRTIQRVTTDLSERCQPNTAIAALMELVNALSAFQGDSATDRAVLAEGIGVLLHLLSPFAPHIADELHSHVGGGGTLFHSGWPQADPAALHEATVELPVQINGKVRGRIVVDKDAAEAVVVAAARSVGSVEEHLAGKTLQKVIYKPGRILTLVVG